MSKWNSMVVTKQVFNLEALKPGTLVQMKICNSVCLFNGVVASTDEEKIFVHYYSCSADVIRKTYVSIDEIARGIASIRIVPLPQD